MASELLLVNPRRRRRTTTRKRAQSAAPRRRRRRSTTMRANPANPVNPRRRRRRAPVVHRRRRYRRNPRGSSGIMAIIQPAISGAMGATLLSLAFGYIPLPEAAKTGYVKYAVRAAGAIGIGMLASKFTRGRFARDAAVGAMTVVLTDTIRDLAGGVPGLKFGEMPYRELGYYGPAYVVGSERQLVSPSVGEYVSGMGEYVEGAGSNRYVYSDMSY